MFPFSSQGAVRGLIRGLKTPLHVEAASGNVEVVKMLLNRDGVDVSVANAEEE